MSLGSGSVYHPEGEGVSPQMLVKRRNKRVISKVLESGATPPGGNSLSHWWPFRTRRRKRLLRMGKLAFKSIIKFAGGWWPSKIFLRTVVPPSMRSLLSLAPFVFSTELTSGDGAAAAMKRATIYSCRGKKNNAKLFLLLFYSAANMRG